MRKEQGLGWGKENKCRELLLDGEKCRSRALLFHLDDMTAGDWGVRFGGIEDYKYYLYSNYRYAKG
jgi:hypothetical protein